MPEFHPGKQVETAVSWLQTHLAWLFDAINSVLTGLYDVIFGVLGSVQPLLMAGIFAVIAFWLRGLLPAVLAFAGFAVIDAFGLWDDAMSTLSLVLAAAALTIVLAIPLGVLAARNRAVSAAVRPVLDVMQTMPAFVYLIPGVMFFSVGTTPGLLATIIFSMPPGVRMTELGIRQVDGELVEAAQAFGTPPKQTLTRVQLPLALPTIMAGVNQVIMLALSMVVIAGMAGAAGLGEQVYAAVTQVQIGLGVESGIAVVILAMYLDRMTGALNERVSPLGRRAAARTAAVVGPMRFLRYKPGTAVAVVGVVVLALVAGGVNLMAPDADQNAGSDVKPGKDAGKTVKIGYFPWDEAIATSYLWANILEDRGYRPKLKQLDPGPLYTALAQGQMDFQMDAWLPTTHGHYWEKNKAGLTDVGSWYGPTSLELSTPEYVKGIDSLADLKGKGELFDHKITGIEASAGEMKILKDVLKEYGLENEYKVVSSSTSAMLSEVDRSIKRKKPVLATTWSPHWVYTKYPMKKLKDPKKAWGEGDDIHITASKDFAEDFPELYGWLKDFRFSEKQLGSLEAEIQKGGEGKEKESVRTWMDARPGIVDKFAPVGD